MRVYPHSPKRETLELAGRRTVTQVLAAFCRDHFFAYFKNQVQGRQFFQGYEPPPLRPCPQCGELTTAQVGSQCRIARRSRETVAVIVPPGEEG